MSVSERSEPIPGKPFSTPRKPSTNHLLRLWFGVTEPVSRTAYAVSGFGLMLFKYLVEAGLIWFLTGAIFMPWDFLNPLLSIRAQFLQTAPEWFGWALFVWTLPFLWIAVTMSVRRSADAGRSPWLGFWVLVPLVNLVFMLILCFVPSSERREWMIEYRKRSGEQSSTSAVVAIAFSLLVGAAMTLVSVYLFDTYGAAIFIGTPMMMGVTAGYVHNRAVARSYEISASLGLASIVFGALALLLFALEGVICIAMAIPLLVPMGAFGGILGKAVADASRRTRRDAMVAALFLPVLLSAELLVNRTQEYEVKTAVTIDAPPEVVWSNVIDFPELTEDPAWYFRYGIACPQRARIQGQGVGAIRYCEFTTGTFVEPVTAWEEPYRLAFDVTDQPAPMFELSPYQQVHPPHLDGFLRSNRGEFLLIPLPGNRTRLEGRTWYEVEMFPQAYWTLWTHSLVHRIHERVLNHIKRLSELE